MCTNKKTQDFSWVSRCEHLAHETKLWQHVRRGLTSACDAQRGFLNGAGRVAESIGSSERADRQLAKATAEIRGQFRFRRGRTRLLPGFQSPLLLRTVDQTKVVDASIGLGDLAGANEVRDRDSGQKTDNRNNDHDFHQGEAGFTGVFDLHSTVFFLLCGSERLSEACYY
jgi:hypothetical protein